MGYSATPGAIIRIGVEGAAQSRREIDTVARTMSNLSTTVQSAMRNLAASVGLGAGVAQIIQMSDAYAKFTAQLRLASQSQREYAAAYADVKRIATTSQQGLAETGVLYARIANGTRELGTSQKQVAAITETVNLALKVSGATASESASAQLQLSQAFASGTLRGEEFNAVNEAAPRLMLALADGIGVPVGALKKMAENGLITSKIMADVLPNALAQLREEAKKVQTIAGAFTVLKNNMMEVFALRAESNGAVGLLTAGIGLLANNLDVLTSSLGGLLAMKVAGYFFAGVTAVQAYIAKNAELAALVVAERASLVARAQAQVASTTAIVAATGASLAETESTLTRLVAQRATIIALRENAVAQLTTARSSIASAQAAMAAAAAAGAQSFALRTLRMATAELAVAEQARVVAMAEITALGVAQARVSAQITAATAAQTAASIANTTATTAQAAAAAGAAGAAGRTAVTAGLATRALGVLGGPIGIITTLLGVGAAAWMLWGSKGSEAEKKVADTLADEIDDYLANLNKQIDKLKERNELASKGMTTGPAPVTENEKKREQIVAEINRISKQTDLSIAAKTEMLRVWGGRLNVLTQDMEKFGAQQQKNKDLAFSSKEAEWLGKNGTAAQKIAHELEELRKEYGRVTPEMEKFVRAKHADKGAAAQVKQEASAYATLMTSVREKIAANKLEAAGYATMSDAQKMTIALDAAIATGKNKLSKEHIAEARALIAVVEVQDSALLSAKNVKSAVQDLDDQRMSAYASAMSEVLANEELVATYGMTKLQIEQLTLARLEDRLAQRASLELDEKEVAQLEKMIAAKRRNMTAVGKLDTLDTGSDVTRAKELLDIMTSLDDVTRSAASGMAASFGTIGSAIGDMTTALSGYGRVQAAIAAQLAAEKKDAKNDPVKIKAAEVRASEAAATAQIRQYGDMAGAAKGFFKENSKGYKAMEGAEKAYRAFEMAMAIKTMLTKSGLLTSFTGLFVASKATETAATQASVGPDVAASQVKGQAAALAGVAGQAQGDPYSAWARMAAMAAAMAALGFVVSGGSKPDTTAKDRQAAAGTGSVFGDFADKNGKYSAKSESIARSIELSAANSSIELNYTQGMLRALLNIESSIGGLGNLLIRGSGVTGVMTPDSIGSASKLSSTLASNIVTAGPLGAALDKLSGGWISKMSGKVSNSIFGGNTKSIDTGILANKTTVSGAMAGGIAVSQYNDIKKDGGWFRSDKYSTQTNPLGAEANAQFATIIADMAEGIGEAGKLLGFGGDAFTKRLNGFVVDIGKISTKGLSGEEIQKQLETTFSKLGDDMARYAVGGLEPFQKVGEGYLETLVRIGTNYANLDAVLQSVGMTFGAAGMSSIAAREELLALAGGIDELAGKTGSFADNFLTEHERLAPVQKYVTEQLRAMGLASIDTREEFKKHVLGLNLTTAAGREQYAALMDLQEAFAKTHAATYDLTKSQQAIADERADLQSEWDELTMTSAQLQAKALLAYDPSNRAFAQQIALQRDLKASTEAASDALKTTVQRLEDTKTSSLAYRDSLILGSLSTLTPVQKYLETQRQYNAALAKAAANPADSAAASGAQTAATAFLTASQVINASSAAFISDKAKVLTDMDKLAAIAGVQLTDSQRQLTALDKQVAGITTLNDTARSIEQAILSQGGPVGMQAPVFDVQRYAAGSSAGLEALATEVRALNAAREKDRVTIEALLAETKLLRTDAARHSVAQVDATEAVGETVSNGVGVAVERATYRANNPTRISTR